jgi:hypothetical protein
MTWSSEPRASTSRALHHGPAVLRQRIVNQPATSGARSRGSYTANRRNWAICRIFRTVGRRFEVRTFCVLRGWHPTRRRCGFAGLSKPDGTRTHDLRHVAEAAPARREGGDLQGFPSMSHLGARSQRRRPGPRVEARRRRGDHDLPRGRPDRRRRSARALRGAAPKRRVAPAHARRDPSAAAAPLGALDRGVSTKRVMGLEPTTFLHGKQLVGAFLGHKTPPNWPARDGGRSHNGRRFTPFGGRSDSDRTVALRGADHTRQAGVGSPWP